MASLADLIRSQSAAAQQQGMSHQDSFSQMDPGMERYLAGQESATRGVPLEAPMLAPDDLIGSGLIKGLLSGAALMGGIKSVGKKAAREAPQAEALRLAQQRAALPVEQNGLGLPANNTPQMRSEALGIDYPTVHGATKPIDQIDSAKMASRLSSNPSSNLGFFSTPNLSEGSRYATDFAREGGNVMPLLVRKGKTFEMPNKQFEELSMGEFTAQGATPKERWLNASEEVKALRQQLLDDGYESVIRFAGRPMEEVISLKPENVRSRFAAFDPWRRNAAIASAMGVAAPDLLASENPDSTRSLKDLIPK